MSADDIIKIIEKLPEYIKLVYPGYMTIYLYYFFRALTIKDNKTIILKAVILSYIYNIIIGEFSIIFFISGDLNYEFVVHILLLVASIVIAYISYIFTKSKRVLIFLQKLNINTTFSTNEIEELESQSENGTWLVAYMEDSNIVYEGFLINKEMEPDKRQYIVLAMYRKYILDEKGKPRKPYIDDFSDNCKQKVMIFYNKISHLEVRDTTENTSKIKESA